MPASEVYESAMLGPDEVKVIVPWQLHINVSKPCVAMVYFASRVKVDKQGNIIAPEDALWDAITSYLHMTFGESVSHTYSFNSNPTTGKLCAQLLGKARAKEATQRSQTGTACSWNLGGWLLKGESGELLETQRFCWIEQCDDVMIEVKKVVLQAVGHRSDEEEGESFDLNGEGMESSMEADSEPEAEAVPLCGMKRPSPDVDAMQPSKPKKAKKQAHTCRI
ncbi:hypothetical protein M422DRAFT_56175 [Sphaerobolus stellatus SS14]|uniref:Uncharacterized protein n=1 Tax=Sphaerobolus stellatus (strain SS14) TaxID=990650 RepID=A0A0C9U7D2_SPHS4|nr:hypothetical protein M422DRAFT_56175 [Sphaerobolus stellatus SS14]